MYESHFGLKSRPFGSKAEGDSVFVGPGQVDIVNGLHKGLLVQDAVVAVSGPVGSGKTTVVNRGLETMSPGRMAAWVGRMKVSAEEILELLLAGFGFNRKSMSTLQRFAAFRRYMHERAAGGVPVAIVIEDARKLGAAVLAEIEALTASDTTDGGGANIILMGDEGLNGLLADPELARLKQRIRRRMQIRPLTEAETTGYLKHAIRAAGSEYGAVFDEGVANIVYACSEGTPRLINSLCESAMTAAMDAGDTRVSARLVHEIAVNNFGFDGPAPTTDVRKNTPEAGIAPEPAIDPEPAPADEAPVAAPETPSLEDSMLVLGIRDEDIPATARNLVVEFGRYPEELPVVEDPAGVAPVDERPEESAVEIKAAELAQDFSVPVDDEPTLTDIPEFINDTQPQLDALSEAVGELLAASRDKEPSAAPAPSTDRDRDSDEDDNFDLDAALSPDVESTNMMPGITPNLDELVASETTGPKSTPPAAPEFDDLPTLSDSMRVDVKKEVEKAERVEAKNAEDAVDPEPDIAEVQATAEAPPDVDVAPPEVDFGDVLDSVLEAEPEAAFSVTADEADNEQDAAAEDEAPAELSLAPSVAQGAKLELSLGQDPEPEASLDDELALEPDPELMLESEVQAEPIAEHAVAAEPAPESRSEDTQDNAPVMNDPAEHVADLATDLDALEAALQAAKSGDFGRAPPSPRETATANSAKPEPVADTPEITIDRVLAEQQEQTRKLEAFTAAMEGVSSLEQIDDLMAETLFGEEFTAIADSVVAEGQLVDPNARYSPESRGDLDDAPIEASNDDAVGVEAAPAVNGSRPGKKVPNGDGELRESVALRIDVLNQMKAKITNERTEVVELGGGHAPEPRARGPQPEPIERQINTSMTQTLQALKVAQTADAVAEEKSKKKSGGLFSRFRRSS